MEGASAGAGPPAGLPRPQSVEDLVGGLWKLGRTPSEAEFTQFLAAGGAAAHAGGAAGGAAEGESPTMQAAMGMHRVASIDLLRKMILNQQAVMSQAQAAASASVAEQAQALAAASGLAGVPLAAPLMAPNGVPVVFPPVLPDWGKVLAGRAGDVSGAGAAAPSGGKAKAAPAAKKESARAKAAKERAAAAAAEAAEEEDEEELDPDGEEYDEADVLKSMGKGPFTAEEIRRQRRMLSNRESARRSRRRKLEHVHTLQGQINVLRAEGAGVVARLQEAEARADALARENGALKAELDRLAHQVLELGGTLQPGGPPAGAGGAGGSLLGGGGLPRSGSLQRVASAERLSKRMRDDSPAAAESPRGFVPFRSLRSYENLLSLQAQQAQTTTGMVNSAA